jgi:glyoxylate carboligase
VPGSAVEPAYAAIKKAANEIAGFIARAAEGLRRRTVLAVPEGTPVAFRDLAG